MTHFTNLKSRLALLTLTLFVACVAGCGPGFPLMTKEQEDLVVNVGRLVKENESLKARVEALEGRNNGSGVTQEIDALKLRLAGINSDMDKIRQDFSFVQGAVETDDHAKTETKEAVKAVAATLTQTNERLAALEKSLRDVTVSVETHDKRLGELQTPQAAQSAAAAAAEVKPAAGGESAATTGKEAAKTPEDLYAIGYNLTVDKRFDEASLTLTSFLSAYPDHKLASNAQYWLGEVYYAKGDYERAILEFDKVVKKYPKADKSAAATLKEGFSFEKLGAIKEFKVLMETVIERYPGSPEADIAAKRLKAAK